MNEFVLDAKNTLEKISSFKCASFKKLSDGSLIFQLDFEGDQFFGMFKHFLDEYLLINITNPITYIDDEEAIVNFEIANDFNKKAIGVKGVIADLEKKQVMFSREEIVRIKDRFNKDLIDERIKFSISLLHKSLDIFSLSMDEFENGREEK
ncbi:hypothetical protein PE051_09785 [Enterobacter asburiae]|nr:MULTISPECIES: hypothetical protein [Enterobacter]ALL17301.1 hypothetical protein NI40_009110 [Enterobacter sp. E20]KJI58839.1 hypothetical protein UP00_20570 [Enterobacter asburiae]MCK7455282.1 hypothetical protein [Enterobacter asburiae]MDD9577786.1 hypothetical protein [Enterobacter sp. FR 78]MDX7661736.1 hypothetical protein [Enterobacter asburiae]